MLKRTTEKGDEDMKMPTRQKGGSVTEMLRGSEMRRDNEDDSRRQVSC